jgi:hypothetical protein
MRQSGKKIITKAIHEGSSRAEGPFIIALMLYKKEREEQILRQVAAVYRGGIKGEFSKWKSLDGCRQISLNFTENYIQIKRKMIELWLSKAHFRKLTIYKN